jgi:hypothetical protein
MFTHNNNRNSKFQIAFTVVISMIAILTLGMTKFSATSVENRSYDALERIRAGRSVLDSSSAARDYQLGERYGATPNDVAKAKALREYWLGERYGQTPLNNQPYDRIEQMRLHRGTEDAYATIEPLRLGR